jgi:hypothetical protein
MMAVINCDDDDGARRVVRHLRHEIVSRYRLQKGLGDNLTLTFSIIKEHPTIHNTALVMRLDSALRHKHNIKIPPAQ